MFRLEKLGTVDPKKAAKTMYQYVGTVQLKHEPELQILGAALCLLALARRSKCSVPTILQYATRVLDDPEFRATPQYRALRMYEDEQIHSVIRS